MVAALALLVVGRRRGWLDRCCGAKRPAPAGFVLDEAALEDGSGHGKLAPKMDPGGLSLLPASTDEAAASALPLSYLSSVGHQYAGGSGQRTSGAGARGPTSQSPRRAVGVQGVGCLGFPAHSIRACF